MLKRVDRSIDLLISLVIGLLIALVAILPERASGWVTGAIFAAGFLSIIFLLLYRQEYIFTGPKPCSRKYEKGQYKTLGDWKVKHKGGYQGNDRGVKRKRLWLGGRDLQALSCKVTTSEPFWRAGVELSSVERQKAEMNTSGSLLFHIGRNGTKDVYPDPKHGLQHLQDKYAVIAYCDQSLEATSPPDRLGKGKEELAPVIPEQVLGERHEPGETFTIILKITGLVGGRVLEFEVLDKDGKEIFSEELNIRVISGFLKNCYLMTWADGTGGKSKKDDITISDIRCRAFPKI